MNLFEYDKVWQKWEEMRKYGPASRHSRRLILNSIEKLDFKSVLDIGCGNGLLLSELRKRHNVKIYGCDISEEAVNLAKKFLQEGEFYVFDISKDFVDKKFDLVLCCDVLEHIEDYRNALLNIRKMTARYFLLTTLQGRMREFEKNVGHVRNFNKKELSDDLSNSGFEIIKIIEWGFPFYSPFYRSLFNIKGVEKFSYGEYNLFKKIISTLIYFIFYLNTSKYGDYLVILCKVK